MRRKPKPHDEHERHRAQGPQAQERSTKRRHTMRNEAPGRRTKRRDEERSAGTGRRTQRRGSGGRSPAGRGFGGCTPKTTKKRPGERAPRTQFAGAYGEAPAPGGGTRGPEGISTGADRGCVSESIVARARASCEGAKVKTYRELFTECP